MATYCRHPYIHLRARSYVSLRSGGSILLSKAGPFLASGEAFHPGILETSQTFALIQMLSRYLLRWLGENWMRISLLG